MTTESTKVVERAMNPESTTHPARRPRSKLRKLFLALVPVAAVGLLVAQTTVRVDMLSGPSGGGRVMVLAPNGNVTFATIGAGITLVDTGGGAWVLQAQASARVLGEKPVRQPDGTYVVARTPAAGSLAVYRNGVRQSVGDDYAFDAAARSIAPVAGHPWNTDDLVLVDYE